MSVTYREFPAPQHLDSMVACLWESESVVPTAQRIVPDGCVDLIWLSERQMVVAGPDTVAHDVVLPIALRSSGIRLRPGSAASVLGLPAAQLRDQIIELDSIWGPTAHELVERLTAAPPKARLGLLAQAVARRHAHPDMLVLAAAGRLALPGSRIGHVAADLGVTERTLHRRTLHAVGYGPKMLARVARLRRLAATTGSTPALRALEAGYASQAHMNDEVRRLTGTTAVRFLEDPPRTAA